MLVSAWNYTRLICYRSYSQLISNIEDLHREYEERDNNNRWALLPNRPQQPVLHHVFVNAASTDPGVSGGNGVWFEHNI